MRFLGRLWHTLAESGRADAVDVTISSSAGAHSLQFRVQRRAALLVLIGFALLGLLMIGMGVFAGHIVRQVAEARRVKAENVGLRRQLLRMTELDSRIRRLEATRRALLRITGVDDADISMPDTVVKSDELLSEDPIYAGIGPDSVLTKEQVAQVSRHLTTVPVDGRISRGFGRYADGSMFHTGIDLAGDSGQPVRAAGDGVISFIGYDETLGEVLVVSHGDGVETLYGHNSRILVRLGDAVKGGETIAEVGNTGLSSGPHLHLEVRLSERAIDPAIVMPGLRR